METIPSSSVESVTSSDNNDRSGFLNRFGSPKGFIVFILVILILGGAVAFSQRSGRNGGGGGGGNNPSVTPTISEDNPQSLSPHTIVYGNWRDGKSYIKAYDLSTQKEYILGVLPTDIKKVSILSPNKLLYIGNTDNKSDHGENISIYDIPSKESIIVYKADINYGIDDYVISQNKKYISTWEVSLNPASKKLLGGKSKVYSSDLSTLGTLSFSSSSTKNQGKTKISSLAQKNLIYDEQLVDIAHPAHYPRAITNNKEIFLDTFVPNSGAGWAYGMSYSNFDATIKKDIPDMKNGAYGTQPSISPDERFLVFSGYDKTDGTEIEGGYRKAVLKSNTVELLDTQTKERRTLIPSRTDDSVYMSASWNYENGDIVFSLLSKDKNLNGAYTFDLQNKISKKINTNQKFISSLVNGKYLVGESRASTSSIGNLGNEYTSPFVTFSIVNKDGENITRIKISDPVMQFISLMPSNYFQNTEEVSSLSNKKLQLQTFNFKPSLAPFRQDQQSKQEDLPTCPDMRYSQCSRRFTAGTPEFGNCMETTPSGCYDSPLYLYGKSGTKVNIRVKTYVYNSNPSYNPEKGYDVLLKDNGKMEVNGKTYDRINYDYLSKKVAPPLNGIVTENEKLKETLQYLALNLGLNTKETQDLVNYGINNIKSPFVFVSFFDDKTSKEILPITFNPTPDTYINIVFYFKEYEQKPQITPKPLEFKIPPQRKELVPRSLGEVGFTAVEVSEIVER